MFYCLFLLSTVSPASIRSTEYNQFSGQNGQYQKRPKNRPQAIATPSICPCSVMNCSRGNSDQYRLGDMLGTSDRNRVTAKRPKFARGVMLIAARLTIHGLHSFLRNERNHDECRDRVSPPPSQSRIEN